MDKIDVANRKFNNPFIALRHKNFRYYWIGMCVSLIGTWMQNAAQPWLALNLTNSPFLVSLIVALQFTPALLFSLFAGVIIDKIPKKSIILCTQGASLLVTLILAILVVTGTVAYWHIVVLAIAIGFVNTFDMPARQSFVIELVGKEDLMNAVALNSSVFNLARVIGPAVAGIIMAKFGIAFCFFANSISFGAVVLSLVFIKPIEMKNRLKKGGRIFSDIKEGLLYIYKKEILLNSLLMMLIIGTFAMNLNVLIPVFAKVVLKQKEAGFGLLMSCTGVGSFIGAMMLASMSKSGPKRFFLNISPLIIGILLIITGFTNVYILTGLCLATSGFFFISFSSTANSTMQLNSDDAHRGRVMSVYSLVFAGSTPIGSLYTGVITQHLGAKVGFAACGLIILLLLIPLYIYRSRRTKRNKEFILLTDRCHTEQKKDPRP